MFDTGTLDGFKQHSIVGCFLEFVFLFSVVQVLVVLRNEFVNNIVFPTGPVLLVLLLIIIIIKRITYCSLYCSEVH